MKKDPYDFAWNRIFCISPGIKPMFPMSIKQARGLKKFYSVQPSTKSLLNNVGVISKNVLLQE